MAEDRQGRLPPAFRLLGPHLFFSFGLGVVSGVVLSYQFGTNFSRFSEVTGNSLGPLMTYEVLCAFFLEAGFVGIMLFGWNRVRPAVHYFSTLMVALGTLASAFWIFSANSWMHTPAGAELVDGVFRVTDWAAVVFNPSLPYRLVHMVLASSVTAAFVMAGVSAWYLLKRRHRDFARRGFVIPFVLVYTAASYRVFRGKVRDSAFTRRGPLTRPWPQGG